MVMIGSLFAGHEESPGEEKIVDGKAVKEYFGSASEFQKGERKNVEGKKIFIDSKGSIFDTLTEMEQDLQSRYFLRWWYDSTSHSQSRLCTC